MILKSGFKTSEFLATMLMSISAILVLVLGLQPDDAAILNGTFEKLGLASTTILAEAVVIWKYISGRTELKLKESEKSS